MRKDLTNPPAAAERRPAQTPNSSASGPADREDEAVFCERFETLEAGRYWRAIHQIDEFDIPSGQVLLLESIRWVDNEPHTILLRPHPTSGKATPYRFRIDPFLDLFEFEPDGPAIREEELKQAQGDIQEEQNKLIDAQSSPEALRNAMREDGFLESSPGSTDLISHQDFSEQVRSRSLPALLSRLDSEKSLTSLVGAANRMRDEAAAQSKWLTSRIKTIKEKVERLTPFFEEKAAVAMAATEDVRSDVDGIMRGLQTLGLFVGKEVFCEQILTGRPAPDDLPLTLQQRRLYANEELAVFRTVSDDFDVREEWRFFDAMKSEPALVDQVFTSERAVVMMAVRRDSLRYGEGMDGLFKSMQLNPLNQATFFLVRNGNNIYRVFSPELSHEKADHLFPLQGEQDSYFKGSDSESITFDDVRYTDSLAAHDRYLIHYRRILILLFGLEMRDGILGSFYPVDEFGRFLSLEFQERYFRFVQDADGGGGSLGDGRPTIHQWIGLNHDKIRHGSLVMGDWGRILTKESAPAAFSGYSPVEDFSCAQVDLSSGSPRVKVAVHGETNGGRKRTFNCSVDLRASVSCNAPYLVCVDDVAPDELRYYIHNRTARKGVLSHMPVFAQAALYLEDSDPDWIDSAVGALVDGGASESLALRIAYLRARFGGIAAHSAETVDTLRAMSKWTHPSDNEVAKISCTQGGEMARLELDPAKGTLLAYMEPEKGEMDDRLQPFSWYRVVTFDLSADEARVAGQRWERRSQCKAGLLPVFGEYPLRDRLKVQSPVFSSPSQKRAFFEEIDTLSASLCADMLQPENAEVLVNAWAQMTYDAYLDNRSRMVTNVAIGAPIGAISYGGCARTVCVGLAGLDAAVYLDYLTGGELRHHIKFEFVRRYSAKDYQSERFDEAIAAFDPSCIPWHTFSAPSGTRQGCFWLEPYALPRSTFAPSDSVLTTVEAIFQSCDPGRFWVSQHAEKVLEAVHAPVPLS